MADRESPPDTLAPPGIEDWRRLVTKSRGISSRQHRTRDGIVIEPLYMARTPAQLLQAGNAPWTAFQTIDDPDPETANKQALEDLAGGAAGLQLRFAADSSPGRSGLPVAQDALGLALEGVDLAVVSVRVEPHPQSPKIACWLQDLVARRGIAPELPEIGFGLDPIGVGAVEGTGAAGPEAAATTFEQLRAVGFGGPLAELDGRIIHEACGTEAQELGFVLASAAWWLRALQHHAIPAPEAFRYFGASLAVDCDQFLSIAKLRALRLLWTRLQELCGAEPAPLAVHAETSRRMMTRAEPHTNLVRTTIAAFAAAVGGADSLAVRPFTSPLSASDRNARALALNIQLILGEECGLARAPDPAAGSGAVETLTDALAERAWGEFQAIEREGGVLETFRSGGMASRVAGARQALEKALKDGSASLVGVTLYRDPRTEATEARSMQPAMSDADTLSPVLLEDLFRRAA